MSENVERLLTQLEELSARAVALTAQADTVASQELIARRGLLLRELTIALNASPTPFSYTDWNRLVVIHHQGNRMHANLETARGALATALLENAREQALLECMSGIVVQTPPRQLNEHA